MCVCDWGGGVNTNMTIGTCVVLVGIIGTISAFIPNDRRDEPSVRLRRIAYQVIFYGILPIVAGAFFFAAGWTEQP